MTGEFNEETREFMAIPRCGNVDIQREGRGQNSKMRQKCRKKCRKKCKEKHKKKCKKRCKKKCSPNNTKGKWRHTDLTYKIINYSTQLPSTDVCIYIFSISFSSFKKNIKTGEVHRKDISRKLSMFGFPQKIAVETATIPCTSPVLSLFHHSYIASKVDWAVVQAMKDWSAATTLTFTEVSGEADIDISFNRFRVHTILNILISRN